jgi:phosphatidylglycerol:prolipoprotein diacylglycerol transferase
MAVMRVGCFMMGCCYGVASDVPWALSFPPKSQAARQHAINGWVDPGAWSLPVHPLQVYFGLASLAVGLALVWFRRRKRYDGQVFLIFLLLHEGAKGGLEFLRGALAQHSVVHLRVASLTIATLAAAVLAVQHFRAPARAA